MVTEHLMNEIKNRYPIGCKVRSAYDRNITGVLKSYEANKNELDRISLRIKNGNYLYFYYQGKWAEVISYPENYSPHKIYELWT